MRLPSLTVDELKHRIEASELGEPELRELARRDRRSSVRSLARRALSRLARASRERARLEAMLAHERELWARGVEYIAGVDEVGVGPLAGPVVAAAVVLPVGCSIPGINDSKALDAPTRERLAAEIRACAVAYAVARAELHEIETLNIFHASRQAMRRAVLGLAPAAQHLLVDARVVPDVAQPQTAIVRGDSLSQSIAAASIVAKVERDHLMDELGRQFPGYGFETHRGYPTPEHLAALERLGPCSVHRRTFGPVAALLRSGVAAKTPP